MFLKWDDNVDVTIPTPESTINITIVNSNDHSQDSNHSKHHLSLNAL